MWDTEETSMISTVPTDLTVTTDSEATKVEEPDPRNKKPSKRRELLHEVTSLKIAVSQKNMVIERLQGEQKATLQRMDAMANEKKALKIKLETKLNLQEENLKVMQQRSEEQLEEIVKRLHHLQVINSKLQVNVDDLKQSLSDLCLTEYEYEELNKKSIESLTVWEYVALRVYKEVWPMKSKYEEVRSQKDRLEREVNASQREIEALVIEVERSKVDRASLQRKRDALNTKYQAVYRRLEDAEPLIRTAEQTRTERDNLLKTNKQLENKVKELTDAWKASQAGISVIGETQQRVHLLEKDKDYLAEQLNHLKSKLRISEDRANEYQLKLTKAESERDEVMGRMMAAREESERRIRDELAKLNLSTSTKIERAQMQARETYAEKMRLVEAERDRCQQQKEQAERGEKEAREQYQQLIIQNQHSKISDTTKISEMEAELRIAKNDNDHGELERLQLEEQLRTTREANSVLTTKLDVQTQQLLASDKETSHRMMKLESQLRESKSKLEVYEKLEEELDGMVEVAAEKEHKIGMHKELGMLPASSQRRLMQSLDIMQKLLKAEKQVSRLEQTLQETEERERNLKEEMTQLRERIDLSKQPTSFLMNTLSSKDTIIRELHTTIRKNKEELDSVRSKYKAIVVERNQVAQDLERLLANREEYNAMKKVILSYQNPSLH